MSVQEGVASGSRNGEMEDVHEKKRRRVQRACDMCRLKRVRCEGGQMSRRACSNCLLNQYDCTYTQSAKPNSDKAYIESLENRLAKMEALMKKLAPEALADQSNDISLPGSSSFVLEGHVKENRQSSTPSTRGPSIPVDADDLDSSDDEFSARQTLEQSFKNVTMGSGQPHFFGKSSTFMFLHKAMDIRHGYSGGNSPSDPSTPSLIEIADERVKFWRTYPWLKALLKKPEFSFPPDDLMPSLIDSYFSRNNALTPLLHRPTFDKGVREGLHLRDGGFASVLLLVCAIGARHSDDPRVTIEGFGGSYSAGWPWFYQVHSIFHVVNFEPPRLYDLQIACLLSTFLFGTYFPEASWSVVGVGLRMAQTLGAHRLKVYDSGPTVETELLKRAFWVLVGMDRGLSSAFGRPCAVQDEDFDVDLPIECDDEYWDSPDPQQAFKQPPGKPCRISFYICSIRLNQIHAFALRTIYSINKSKATLGHVGPQWEEKTVAELDSALNNFIDSVPDHLKWNPHQENMLFLNQSAILYTQYYGLQITVHRPFIPSPRKPSRSSFPSLAICTNAARSCVHILDVQYQRAKQEPEDSEYNEAVTPIATLFSCVMVLLLNLWGAKRSGSTIDHSRDISDLHKAMRMLKDAETRSPAAGRLWDVLHELTNGDFPITKVESPVPNRKRTREQEIDEVLPLDGQESFSQAQVPTTYRLTETSNQSANSAARPMDDVYLDADLSMPFTLPLHSYDLGRLPLHPQSMSFSAMSTDAPATSSAVFSLSTTSPNSQDGLYVPAHGQLPTVTPASSSDSAYPSTGYAFIPRSETTGNALNPDEAHVKIASESLADDDTLEMWSTAPASFDWDDWGKYLTNFGDSYPDLVQQRD